MTKLIKWHVRPAKTKISLWIRPVWSESSLSAWRKLGSLATHWVHSEDWSDWADAQADLNLRWVHMPFCWFCHEAAQMSNDINMTQRVSLYHSCKMTFSHTWDKNIPFYGCLRFFFLTHETRKSLFMAVWDFSVSACLSQSWDFTAVSNCQSLLYIESQELLLGLQLQNFLSKLEKLKRCSDFRTFTVLFIRQKLQEFDQNLIDIHSAKCQ